MLAIPPFGASSNIALWRANNKPPLEVVVANLERSCEKVYRIGRAHSAEQSVGIIEGKV